MYHMQIKLSDTETVYSVTDNPRFCVREFGTKSDERMSCSKSFLLLEELGVRKFTLQKFLGLCQTVLVSFDS